MAMTLTEFQSLADALRGEIRKVIAGQAELIDHLLIALFARMATTGRADLPSGTYRITKPLAIPPGLLTGGNIVLDFRGADPEAFPARVCVLVQGGPKTALPARRIPPLS